MTQGLLDQGFANVVGEMSIVVELDGVLVFSNSGG
jgi:hypothetical protein